MKRRSRVSYKGGKRLFRKTAGRTHVKNIKGPIMRGGIRL